jgi:hypothetical protein
VYFGGRCDDQRHMNCNDDGDCDDCRTGDVCTAEKRVCLANDGSSYFFQQNVWYLRVGSLGMAASFDFNNFELDERLENLTHESTNWLKLNE